MVRYNVKCLVVVVAAFLPTITDSIDEDFTNPVSQNIPLENIGLAALNKLTEAAELEDKINETLTNKSGILQIINVTANIVTTEKILGITNKEIINSTQQSLTKAKAVKLGTEEDGHDEISEPEKADEGELLKDQDQTKVLTRESVDNSKVVGKRETDFIELNHECNSTALQPSMQTLSKSYIVKPQQDQLKSQGSCLAKPGCIDDPDNSRRFRDVFDENGNMLTVEEKLQPDQNSLFSSKNPSPVVLTTKNRCSLCEDRMQKVVPEGSSFIELGCDHEEDDASRPFQDMLNLIDNIIESSGNAKKDLGLRRKSTLSDAACLLTYNDDKLEKTIMQIVSCVKGAMQDTSSKNCIPLPRELHSFLIWLMHGSEGGDMVPPTVQEIKSKPSYLFHEDNHRLHLGGFIDGTPPCPSGSLMELVTLNKGMPMQPSKLTLPVKNQEKSEPGMNLQPQYEVENNDNSNNQYLGEQKNDIAYQRKLPFVGRNYYRPLRSVPSQRDTDFDNGGSFIKDPINSCRSDLNEFDESSYINDSEYERFLRNADSFSKPQPNTAPDKNEKSTIKRDLTRKKTVSKKCRDDLLDNNPQRKKKRRDGLAKSKKMCGESPFELKSSVEFCNDVQEKLPHTSLKVNKIVCSRYRKDRRRDKKKSKGANQKDLENYITISNRETNGNFRDYKQEENKNNANSTDLKSSIDEPSLLEEPMNFEQESISPHNGKTSHNKQKKKKHKIPRLNFNKDEKLKTTETPLDLGTVTMNISEFTPNVDLATTSTLKKNRNFNQESTASPKNFQISLSNKVSKSNKSKPNIVFEDYMPNDSSKQEDEEDYTESDYDLNETDDYEQSYEDENEDLYYDQRDSKTSRIKNKGSSLKEINKNSKETIQKPKPLFSPIKRNRVVKRKKKPNPKTNDKSQIISDQQSVTVKMESPQSKPSPTELSPTAATESQSNLDSDIATETGTSAYINQENVNIESNAEIPNKSEKSEIDVSVDDKKDTAEETTETFSELKDNSEETIEQGSNREDTGDHKMAEKEEKSDTALEENQNQSTNLVLNPEIKTEVLNSQENQKPSLKGKLCSKDVSKLKYQSTNRSGGKRKQEVKKKLSKAVSKARKDKLLSRIKDPSRSKVGLSMKSSQADQDAGLNSKIVSKTRHKVINDEEEDSDDEGIQCDLTDQEECDDETDGGSEDDDALDEVKPKTQMWVDEDRSLLDPYTFSNIEVSPNSDLAENSFVPKPAMLCNERGYHVMTNKNPPFSKDTFLKMINSPELQLQRRNFAKERKDKLLNVTELLNDVHMLGDHDLTTTSTQDNAGGSKKVPSGPFEAKGSLFSDITIVKLTTVGPKSVEGTELRPTYRTTLIQPSPRTSQPRQDAESDSLVSHNDIPSNLSSIELGSEFHCFPFDRVSLRKPFGDILK